ncbi:uncharacterized protein LOC118750639 [Rhagoletis pomonella]|uniref:uncharacterized protein LOC118750639 n=1 Tax=Rhagoletis pomonella TaxID=28610 RepID=UPI001783CB22|nr:uncharacterized protein LOC118750639 [Rhagoletis pomonella]
MEECQSERKLSELDQWCEDFYKSTTTRMDNGKYVVRLPLLSYLDPSVCIGTSKHVALKRLLYLERRLVQCPSLRQIYRDTIDEYLQLGQMEPVNAVDQMHHNTNINNTASTLCYLPHHPVVKESSSTTKVRIVFDASAKTNNGRSLNDILATGPALQTDLSAVLTNWRFYKYAFLADVEKMYRAINVHRKDAQYQRILWRQSPDDQIKEYYCSTVMFGTRSAPFLAIRTIQQLADDESRNFPLAVNVIKHQMYVDDVLSGGDTIEEALEVQAQTRGMLNNGTFLRHKWSSNHSQLLERIPIEHREMKGSLQINTTETLKA